MERKVQFISHVVSDQGESSLLFVRFVYYLAIACASIELFQQSNLSYTINVYIEITVGSQNIFQLIHEIFAINAIFWVNVHGIAIPYLMFAENPPEPI